MQVPIVPRGEDFNSVVVSQFLEIVRKNINQPPYNSQATDPTTAGVPAGTWSVWKNTTSGLVKVWVNDNGVMKSVTLV